MAVNSSKLSSEKLHESFNSVSLWLLDRARGCLGLASLVLVGPRQGLPILTGRWTGASLLRREGAPSLADGTGDPLVKAGAHNGCGWRE